MSSGPDPTANPAPTTGRAWAGFMHALNRDAPRRLGQVVAAGRAMQALTGTKAKR